MDASKIRALGIFQQRKKPNSNIININCLPNSFTQTQKNKQKWLHCVAFIFAIEKRQFWSFKCGLAHTPHIRIQITCESKRLRDQKKSFTKFYQPH